MYICTLYRERLPISTVGQSGPNREEQFWTNSIEQFGVTRDKSILVLVGRQEGSKTPIAIFCILVIVCTAPLFFDAKND